MYPSSTPHQQQQQPTSIRRAQLSSSSSRALGSKQGVREAQLGGGSVRFPCRGVSPPSPRQQQPTAPPKQQSACIRRTLFLLPSSQQQQQRAQLNNSSPSLGPPPPGHKSSSPPEVQTPVEGRLQPKCQHQQPTSRVTGACCPQRSRGDPPVLRRGQARYSRASLNHHKPSLFHFQAVQDSV